MIHRARVVVLVVAAAVVALSAAPDVDLATSRRLIDSALNGQSLEYVRGLTSDIGARLTGTSSYERAARWAADRFREAGVRAVGLEPFTVARGWERGPARARIISPVERPLAVESFGWSPATPERGIEGDLVLADDRTPSAERVRGRIVLTAGAGSRDADAALARAGALAVLYADSDSDDQPAARVRHFGGNLAPLASAMIARGDAATLRRLMEQGRVRVALELANTVSDGPVTVSNVVAEIRGRESPDEWVLVGAHLDSWDLAVGAQDNAAGVAMVLDAARAIAALDRRPRRSIRFALWGGEEQGLLGSAAYVTSHDAELGRAVAVLNADGGTGRIIGWTTPGRDDVMQKVSALSAAILTGLGSTAVDRSMRYAFDSDGGPFVRRGVPVLDLNVDDSRYEEIHHKTTDTLDRVDPRNLAVGAATVAATAYAIADAPARLAPRVAAPRGQPRPPHPASALAR